MKIAIDIGHNIPGVDVGAIAFAYEDTLNKILGELIIKKLRARGHSVTEMLPLAAKTHTESLELRCAIANRDNVDMVVSIHHNAGGGEGTEIWYASEDGKEIGEKVLYAITNVLPYRNRGMKKSGVDGKRLKVLFSTDAPAILVEVCFVDNHGDVAIWQPEALANAIADALVGRLDIDIDIRKKLQIALNDMGFRDFDNQGLDVDGIVGPRTKHAIGELRDFLDNV